MLILTTNAYVPGVGPHPAPDWPGPHVLVVLPGSGATRGALDRLGDSAIVIEWLEPPAGLPAVLCDVMRWLEPRLHGDEGPLLCLHQPVLPAPALPDPAGLALHAVETTLDADGHLTRLVLGEMVATSPLLPAFLRMLDARRVDDRMFVTLLTEAFAWGTA